MSTATTTKAPKTTKTKATKSTKAAKVAPAKKGAKKVAPAKAEKVEGGLTKRQELVLKALKSGKAMTRVDLAKATDIAKGWSKLLGSTKPNHGAGGKDCMEALGLITCAKEEGVRQLSYTITKAGIKALENGKA